VTFDLAPQRFIDKLRPEIPMHLKRLQFGDRLLHGRQEAAGETS